MKGTSDHVNQPKGTVGKLLNEVALQVERGVVQKHLGDLDDGADFVGVDVHLGECVVVLRIGPVLVDQACFTLAKTLFLLKKSLGFGLQFRMSKTYAHYTESTREKSLIYSCK